MSPLAWLSSLAAALLAAACAFVLAAGLAHPYQARALLHIDAPGSAEAIDRVRAAQTDALAMAPAFSIETMPDYLPLVGRLAARLHDDGQPARAWFGSERRAFGGETVRLDIFEPGDESDFARLALVVEESPAFVVTDVAGRTLAEGEAGRRLFLPGSGTQLRVSVLDARPGTRLFVTRVDGASEVARFLASLGAEPVAASDTLYHLQATGDAAGDLGNRLTLVLEQFVSEERRQTLSRAAASARQAAELVVDAKAGLDDATLALEEFRASSPRESLDAAQRLAIEQAARTAVADYERRLRRELGGDLLGEPEALAADSDEHAAAVFDDPGTERYGELTRLRDEAFGRYLVVLDLTRDLEMLAAGAGLTTARVIEPVEVRARGARVPLLWALGGGAAVFLLAAAFAARARARSARVSTPEHASRAAGAPVTGVLPDITLPRESVLLAQGVRSLATALRVAAMEEGAGDIALRDTGAGKRAASLAALLAETLDASGGPGVTTKTADGGLDLLVVSSREDTRRSVAAACTRGRTPFAVVLLDQPFDEADYVPK